MIPINTIIYSFEELCDLKKNFSLPMRINESIAPFINDIKVVLPELFLATSVLSLILYSVSLATNSKYNYPLINPSVSWLSLLILLLTFILERNNVIILHSIFNNVFIYDNLASIAKSIIILSTIGYLLISQSYISSSRFNAFEYYILILSAVLGLVLLVSAYDLLLAYLAIETQSLSFYVLAAFKRDSAFSTEAGLKYFILGAFSSSLILFGSSLIYGFSGTTGFGDLSSILIGVGDNLNYVTGINVFKVAITFLGAGFLFKLGAAPFHMWSPDIYEGAPISSTALFAIVPKIAIFVLFVRIFQFSFYSLIESWQQILIFSASFSLIIGSFVALKQRKIKRLVAYSAISHVGYLLIAFATGTLEGQQALFFYLYIYMVTGTGIWALIMSIEMQGKKKKFNKNLADLSVLASSNSFLSITFIVIIFSLSGVPPLAGFYAKMQIFFISINSSMYALTILGVLSSVISTFYYIRIIKTVYFEKNCIWNFYKPISQFKSLTLGTYSLLILLLFLNPNLLNLFAYKMVTSIFI
jgi:proton-translocating NADH-quinone oxidoreductase chain N